MKEFDKLLCKHKDECMDIFYKHQVKELDNQKIAKVYAELMKLQIIHGVKVVNEAIEWLKENDDILLNK